MDNSVINDTFEKLWEEANWIATGFAFSPNNQGAIGLVFENKEPALEIFRQWQAKLGKIDVDELLRIAIIEGDISGQEPGYTIHLTSNLDAILKNTDVSKLDGEEELQIDMLSKYQRLQQDEGSAEAQEQGLERFKATFAEQKEYIILPVFYNEPNIRPHFDLAIVKKEIHFRNVRDIPPKDIDSIVFNANYENS